MPDDALPSDLTAAAPVPWGQGTGAARPALDRLARIAALGLGAAAVEIRLTLPDGLRMTGRAGAPDRHVATAQPLRDDEGQAFGEILIEGGAASVRTGALLHEIGALALHEHRLCQMVCTDALTGAATRAAFLDRLSGLAERERRPLSLLMVDIDRFKKVNDCHGHPAGDRVLGAVAARIRARLRRSDVFARVGGEEFCIALPATGARSAWRVASRLRAAIAADPVQLPDGPVPVTVSIGLATATGRAPEQVMEEADRALYRAKRAGRNRVWPALAPATGRAREHNGSLSRV